jgi:type I restriction enzyme S subunit
MRKMKDSGIEWIGEIPEGWEISKLKYNADIFTGNSISDDKKDNFADADNSIPYIATKDINSQTNMIDYENGMYVKNDDINFKKAPKNSTVLCIEGGSAGKKIAFTNREICFVNKLCCFNSYENTNKRFLYYVLQSESFTSEFFFNIGGLIGGVSKQIIRNIKIQKATINEQIKIGNFLNKQCIVLDRIIKLHKTSVEKLKEYKKSLITEAVTKGLNPKAKMKPSGVEWIRDVPQDWKIKKLKFCARTIDEKVEAKKTDLEYVGLENIESCSTKFIKTKIIEAEGTAIMFSKGNVLFGKLRPYLTKAFLADRDGCCSSEFIVFDAFNIHNNYLLYLIISDAFIKIVDSSTYGAKMPRASKDFVQNMLQAVPPLSEQKQISDYLDNKCNAIDKVIKQKELLIEKMFQYKKSLIYEAVTGKTELKN